MSNIKFRIVEYNNKSRKGTYVGVKQDEWKREKVWRYQEGVPYDAYVKAMVEGENQRSFAKAWGITRKRKADILEDQRQKYISRIREKGTLSSHFSKGSSSVTVNIENLNNPSQLKRIYSKLFGDLVLDNEFLDIIIANRHKLGKRFMYKMSIDAATEGVESGHVGNLTDMKGIIPEQFYAHYVTKLGYQRGKALSLEQIRNDLNEGNGRRLEWRHPKSYGQAVISKMTVTITFARG